MGHPPTLQEAVEAYFEEGGGGGGGGAGGAGGGGGARLVGGGSVAGSALIVDVVALPDCTLLGFAVPTPSQSASWAARDGRPTAVCEPFYSFGSTNAHSITFGEKSASATFA